LAISNINLGVIISSKISSSFGSSINMANEQLDSFSKSAENTSKKLLALDKIAKSTNKHKLNIEANALKREELKKGIFDKLALGASVVVPIKVAMDFESSMADVKKVVDFSSENELKSFSNDILKLSRAIPLSANELAQITASGGQLGIAKDDLMDFTTVVAKMSTAFDIAPKDAGRNIAEIMRVYRLGIKDAQDLGDAINHLSDNIGIEAVKIIEVINRIGGTAKIFGLNEVQASALSSAFISLGKSPEVAGTAINTLLTNLVNAPKMGDKFEDALATIGYSAIELKERISTDANGTLQEFLSTLSKVDKSEQMGILTDLFGRGFADDIALLVGSLEQYEKALDLTAKKEDYLGSANREFENRSATTANNLQLLKNSITEISISLGNIFLPSINFVAKALKVVATNFADLMNSSAIVGFLIKAVTGLFGSFVALSVGGTALSYVMTFVSSGFSRVILLANMLKMGYIALTSGTALATAKTLLFSTAQKIATATSLVFSSTLKIVGGAIGFVSKAVVWLGRALLMNPIGLIITAIAVGAYTIYTYWTPIKEFFANLWDSVKSIFNSSLNAIKYALSFNPFSIITQAWSGVFDWFSSKFEFVSNGILKLKSMGETVSNWFSFGNKDEEISLGSGYNKALETSANTTDLNTNNSYTNNTSSNKTSDTSSIVINVNNPVVQTKEQSKVLEQDIKKMVNKVLKEKEQSNTNKTFKDIM